MQLLNWKFKLLTFNFRVKRARTFDKLVINHFEEKLHEIIYIREKFGTTHFIRQIRHLGIITLRTQKINLLFSILLFMYDIKSK